MDNKQAASRLLAHVEKCFGNALESVTAQQFSVTREQDSPQEPFTEPVVWRQPLSSSADAAFWFVAPLELWTMAGRVTLESAGIEEIGQTECRSTWTEICGQAGTAIAQAISADLGREITANAGSEEIVEPPAPAWTIFTIRDQNGQAFPMRVAWSNSVTALYRNADAPEPASTPNEPAAPKTLDLLLDVALPVSVSFGRTSLQIREVLKLNTGSIVELNRFVSEPVDVIVNDCVIARGEVVVVDGNYGVRITQLASREDRLRSGVKQAHGKHGGRA